MTAQANIAHFNWATLRDVPGSPVVAEFIEAVDRVNALAERSAGFVWRLDLDEAAAARALGWPTVTQGTTVIASFSVWESAAHLKAFVYQTVHGAFVRRREAWFLPSDGPNYVLWPVARGHVPTLAEARKTVERFMAEGPGPEAFDFGSLPREVVA